MHAVTAPRLKALFDALGCHTSSKRRADDTEFERSAQLSIPLVFKGPRKFSRK